MAEVFHFLEELGVVGTKGNDLDVFDRGGSDGFKKGEVVVGGVGSSAEYEGVAVGGEVEFVAEVVLSLFFC